MGQVRVLRENTQRHVERAGFVGRIIQCVGNAAAFGLGVLEPDRAHHVGILPANDLLCNDHLHADVLGTQADDVHGHFEMVLFAYEDRLVVDFHTLYVDHTDLIPYRRDLAFPGRDLAGQLVAALDDPVLACRELVVEPLLVVVEHAVGREIRCDVGDAFLDRLHPCVGYAVLVAVVVFRDDLLLDGVVDHFGVELVLIVLVGEGALSY